MKQIKPSLTLWKWGKDRFSDVGNYKIFTIAYSMKIGFDCYIFHYPTGSFIPKHKDPAKFGPQWRLNFTLKKPIKGGEFVCNGPYYKWWRFTLFRADFYYHYVNKIEEGERWLISFGFFPKRWFK